MHRIRADAAPHCSKKTPESRVRWSQELFQSSATARGDCGEFAVPRRLLCGWATPLLLHGAERLVECGAKRAVDRHHLTRRLHLTPEEAIGARELIKWEARQLHHDVVERRFKRGHCCPGHRVRDLAQGAANGDLRRHARDRIPRRLARQRRAAADTRVHLNHHVVAVVGREGELHVAATLHAECADDVKRGAA